MKPERWKEVERLFNAACELEPARREVFLTEACGGDEALRSEVESLLAHETEPGSLIESPAIEIVARDLASDSYLSIIGKSLGH